MARESDGAKGEGSLRREFVDLPGQVPQRSDDDICKDVESALFYDKLVRSYGIRIAVKQGVVTLSGTIGNEFEQRKAVEDAEKVHGVKQVIDQLQIGREGAY